MTQPEDLTWTPILDAAILIFGEPPGAQLEQEAIDAFVADPQHVIRILDRIGSQHQKKHFASPWGIFRSELRKPKHDITADPTAGRAKATQRAEQWIQNAGLHYDRWQDVEADLFGDDYAKGRLTPYNTPELRQHMHDHWLEHRPRGEQAERDHEAWNAQCAANRRRAEAMLKAKHQPEPEPDDEPTFTPAAT